MAAQACGTRPGAEQAQAHNSVQRLVSNDERMRRVVKANSWTAADRWMERLATGVTKIGATGRATCQGGLILQGIGPLSFQGLPPLVEPVLDLIGHNIRRFVGRQFVA